MHWSGFRRYTIQKGSLRLIFMGKDKKLSMKLHPIQMVSLGVKELYIVAHEPPDLSIGVDTEEGGVCSIMVGHGEFNEVDKTISVGLKLEIGESQDTKTPFSLRIELIGTFKVDDSQFKTEHLFDWAHRNAPYVMMPYLREHAFSLSEKCGFRPIILPLTEVPSFKLSKQS